MRVRFLRVAVGRDRRASGRVGGEVAVAVWFGELDELRTVDQLRVRALEPELVWLTHEHAPWRPHAV